MFDDDPRIGTLVILTALACTSLSSSSLNSAARISCLDHKRVQANKLRTSMRTNTTQTWSGRLPCSIPKLLVRYCVPRIGKQSYRTTIFLCGNSLNEFCRIVYLSLIFIYCLIADLIFLFEDNYIFRGIGLTTALIYIHF